MALAQKLYERMPPTMQGVMTTLRGAQLRTLRYTRRTWTALEELQDSQWWSEARLRDLQSEKLQRLVRHAYETVPLYRRKLAEAKLTPADVRGLADLRKIPILTKPEFRRYNASDIVSTATPASRMWAAYTSGTSGMPLRAYFTHEDMQERIAHLERIYQWFNPKRWRRRASFTGKLIVNTDRAARSVCRTNLAIRQWLFSSHHLSEQYLPLYRRDLGRIAPEQIDGILSPMFVVARYLNLIGASAEIRPSVVVVTSETLWPFMRETLSTAFACKVSNQYGSQEGAPIGGECPEGGFHTCPESGIFEILKLHSGEPAGPGEVGRLVVTSFVNHGTPLIRYDIGDVAALSGASCPCGRAMPLLESIHGRADDLFFTSSRGIVPKVDSAFKAMPAAIYATQVAQVGVDRFEIRMKVDPALYKPEFGEELLHNLSAYLGDVEMTLKLLDELPVTPGGKIRAQVNECPELIAEFKDIRAGWDARNQE